jgi:hypothetical protein
LSRVIFLKMSKSTPIVVSVPDWDVSATRYMQPKVNERGGKAINIVSTQSNRSLHLSTPLMMTWGISDFVDEKTGESDGKFSMSLNFPNSDYSTPAAEEFLTKLKNFDKQIIDDAVKNSEAWFGEELSREIIQHAYSASVKYSNIKGTKKPDLTKPPSLRVKVPCYNGKWGVEIYDTKSKKIFPCDNDNMTPMDFIPKKSNVACVVQCGGLWAVAGKWGIIWKLNQCVVKPAEVVSVFGRCHIQLSTDEIKMMDEGSSAKDDDEQVAVSKPAVVTSTEVEDSDEEEAAPAPPVKKVVPEPEPQPESEPVVETKDSEEPVVVKKKIVKKKV